MPVSAANNNQEESQMQQQESDRKSAMKPRSTRFLIAWSMAFGSTVGIACSGAVSSGPEPTTVLPSTSSDSFQESSLEGPVADDSDATSDSGDCVQCECAALALNPITDSVDIPGT